MRLGLTINKLGIDKLMGHIDRTSSINPKPIPEVGGYCTCSSYDNNVGW